ncbi:MAG: hypothetical protein R3B91_00440 [Planctomycetaceae bacterium]
MAAGVVAIVLDIRRIRRPHLPVGIADFSLHLDATTTRLLLTSGIVGYH